ncbi:MAG: LPXTG cell wall anchor domain-containing protein, partial [Aerococcaceae bacterium]|nr:LPXTG cell wall anchor domain-containing protein [Aerococcaceae bacterium]
ALGEWYNSLTDEEKEAFAEVAELITALDEWRVQGEGILEGDYEGAVAWLQDGISILEYTISLAEAYGFDEDASYEELLASHAELSELLAQAEAELAALQSSESTSTSSQTNTVESKASETAVASSTTVSNNAPKQKTLPQTGEASTIMGMVAITLMAVGATALKRRV